MCKVSLEKALEDIKLLEKEVKKIYPNRNCKIKTINTKNAITKVNINYRLEIANSKSSSSKSFHALGKQLFFMGDTGDAALNIEEVINYISNH